MTRDPKLDMRVRQSWFKTYTDAARALNKALKDREEKDWEKRLRQVEEYRKRTGPVLSANSGDDSENAKGSNG